MSAHVRPRKPAVRRAVRNDISPDKPKRVPLRMLPIAVGHFEPEAGIRLDCARYESCLASHVSTYPQGEAPARCPTACRWHVAPGRLAAEHVYHAEGGALARATGW